MARQNGATSPTMSLITPDIMGVNEEGKSCSSGIARGAKKLTTPLPSPWRDAWDGYEYCMEAAGQSRKSISTRRTSVLRLAKAYPARDPETLTRRDIERHLTEIRKTLADQTVFGSFNDLRSFFSWLAQDTKTENIMDGMRAKTPEIKDVPVLTVEQIKALLGTCKGDGVIALRDRAVILMMIESGVRRMELTGLGDAPGFWMSDVDFKAGSAFVRKGKGGKARLVVFGPATADALRKYIRASRAVREKHWGETDSPLFLSIHGCGMGYGGLGLMLTRRGNNAGIPGLHPHQLRHTWVHYSLAGGVGDQNVITLAGWTTAKQLARYGKSEAVNRAVTAARANPVGRMLTRR